MHTRTFSTRIPRFLLRLPTLFLLSLIPLLQSAFFVSNAQAVIYWNDVTTDSGIKLQNGSSDYEFFGQPTLAGENSFNFPPEDFVAESPPGIQYVRENLHFDITAPIGQNILGIVISDYGQYSAEGSAIVYAMGNITVTNLDTAEQQIDFFAKNYAGSSGSWDGQLVITGIEWSRIQVVISNTLVAYASPGGSSFIEINELGASAGGINIEILIPEPATVTIFAFGSLVFFLTKKHPKAVVSLIAIGICLVFTSDAGAVGWSGSTDYFSWENGQSEFGLFGVPRIDNFSTFIFSPSKFDAVSIGMGSVDVYDVLEFDLIAETGYTITDISIIAIGDLFSIAFSSVDVIGTLTVTDLDNSSNIFDEDLDTAQTNPVWNGSLSISSLNCNAIHIEMFSKLTAYAENFTIASVSQTAFQISVGVVPEPATVALLALGSIVFIGKKSK